MVEIVIWLVLANIAATLGMIAYLWREKLDLEDVHDRFDELSNSLNVVAEVLTRLPELVPSFSIQQNPFAPLIEAFAPDVMFTQLGIDTHFLDPITHLRLTTQGFARTVARLGELVGPGTSWVAAGGGGYDLGAVARGWSMAFAVMAGVDIPDRVPEEFTEYPGMTTFADEQPAPLEPAVAEQVRAFAERSVKEVRNTIFPHFDLA